MSRFGFSNTLAEADAKTTARCTINVMARSLLPTKFARRTRSETVKFANKAFSNNLVEDTRHIEKVPKDREHSMMRHKYVEIEVMSYNTINHSSTATSLSLLSHCFYQYTEESVKRITYNSNYSTHKMLLVLMRKAWKIFNIVARFSQRISVLVQGSLFSKNSEVIPLIFFENRLVTCVEANFSCISDDFVRFLLVIFKYRNDFLFLEAE